MIVELRGVIFDLGSTLIRFTGDWEQVLERSRLQLGQDLLARGVALDLETFNPLFRQAMVESYQRRDEDCRERTTASVLLEVLQSLGVEDPGQAQIDAALRWMYALSEACWELMPGAIELLEALQANMRLGIISNAGDEANVQRLIDKTGLRPFVDPILISAAEGIRKPHRALFEKVLGSWQLEPQQVVMVGDNLEADIYGAEQVGMDSIWLTAEIADPWRQQRESAIVPRRQAVSLQQVGEMLAGAIS